MLPVARTFVRESLDTEPPGEPATSAPASSLARGQPLQARRTRLGLRHQGGTPGDPSSRPRQLSRPGTGECRSFQRARGIGAPVLRGHNLKGRAQTSALATPRSDQPEQTGSGGRTSFQALGCIPAPRPSVRPPVGPMLSTGGQYSLKKRGKAVPKRYVRGRGGGWEGSEDPETWLGVWRGS